MNYNNKNYIPSRTSPKGGRRGCLCWETSTYSIECCDGSVRAQGVGSVYLDAGAFSNGFSDGFDNHE